MSDPLGGPRLTFSGDFPDADAFLASGWSDKVFFAASAYREEFENEEAARIGEERAAGLVITDEDFDERLGAISDITFVYFWVGDEEGFRFRQFYDEADDAFLRRALAGLGPLHVECETTVYESN